MEMAHSVTVEWHASFKIFERSGHLYSIHSFRLFYSKFKLHGAQNSLGLTHCLVVRAYTLTLRTNRVSVDLYDRLVFIFIVGHEDFEYERLTV